MSQKESITRALHEGGVIDITTIGKRSGEPRRIEIVFFHLDGRIYISGLPGRRAWVANLAADPRLTFHLKRGIRADLPATATIVTDRTERRRVLEPIVASWGRSHQLEAFMAAAPLIEVHFDDPTLLGHDVAA